MQTANYTVNSGAGVTLWRGIPAQITISGVEDTSGNWLFLVDNDYVDGAILSGTVAADGETLVVMLAEMNTDELKNAIKGHALLTCRATLTDGANRVYIFTLYIRNRAVSGTPTPLAEYYTKAQIDAIIERLGPGGGGGTSDYAELSNKPAINGHTLTGDQTAADLGLATPADIPPAQVQANWNETDPNSKAYIQNKPTIPENAVPAPATPGEEGDVLALGENGGTVWRPPLGNIIQLGPCKALGFVTGEQPSLSWADPDNVELNGAVLAEWAQTDLVRKEGDAFPANHTDGVVVASTEIGRKSAYRDTAFVDTTQEAEKVYRYKLFSRSVAGNWNNLVANQFVSGAGLNWYQIREYVRAGRGPELFPVGTVLIVDHPEYVHPDGTGLWFRVVGYDQVPPANDSLTHSMCLEMVDCLPNYVYDSPELQYALTWDTVALAGKVYFSYNGSTYTQLIDGQDYNVGDPVPENSWYEKNIGDRNQNGSNDPRQSNLMQWLNSNGVVGEWFTPQTPFDRCASDLLNKNGFCRYIDQDFLAVVADAKIYHFNIAQGGYIDFVTKFYLPLRTQLVYSTSTTDMPQFQWYMDRNTIMKRTFAGGAVRYRSLSITSMNPYSSVLTVNDSGGLTENASSNAASYAYGSAPACIIA